MVVSSEKGSGESCWFNTGKINRSKGAFTPVDCLLWSNSRREVASLLLDCLCIRQKFCEANSTHSSVLQQHGNTERMEQQQRNKVDLSIFMFPRAVVKCCRQPIVLGEPHLVVTPRVPRLILTVLVVLSGWTAASNVSINF